MIVLNKKRILFIMLAVVVAVCVPEISKKNDVSIIETTALPVSNKVIVIDAGHGFPDERSRKCKRNN